MNKTIEYYTREGSKYNRYKANLYAAFSQFRLFKKYDYSDFEFTFIVSTGRTGTKFLASLLNGLDRTYALHEPVPNMLKLGNDFLRGKVSNKDAKRIILNNRNLYFKRAQLEKITRFIESNNRYYSLIPILRDLFPNSKFIHVVRDGRDVVRSGMSRNFYTSTDKAYRISASHLTNDLFHSTWYKLNQFEKVCWWWTKKDSEIYKATKNQKDSLIVKFEDIFSDKNDYEGIKSIFEFIGINSVDDYIFSKIGKRENATKMFKFPHWSKWNDSQKAQFNRIAGEHMTNIGYDIF